jgi:hypothetical protein
MISILSFIDSSINDDFVKKLFNRKITAIIILFSIIHDCTCTHHQWLDTSPRTRRIRLWYRKSSTSLQFSEYKMIKRNLVCTQQLSLRQIHEKHKLSRAYLLQSIKERREKTSREVISFNMEDPLLSLCLSSPSHSFNIFAQSIV